METIAHVFRECPECFKEVQVTNVESFVVHKQNMFSIWRPPENQYIQINFDVAYNPQQFRLASGLVARNSKDEVLVSQAILEKDIASLFAAKACAWSQAMRLGIQMGVGKIEIDGDALTIIKKCQSSNIDKSGIGAYIRDIKQLAISFQSIRFKYTSKV